MQIGSLKPNFSGELLYYKLRDDFRLRACSSDLSHHLVMRQTWWVGLPTMTNSLSLQNATICNWLFMQIQSISNLVETFLWRLYRGSLLNRFLIPNRCWISLSTSKSLREVPSLVPSVSSSPRLEVLTLFESKTASESPQHCCMSEKPRAIFYHIAPVKIYLLLSTGTHVASNLLPRMQDRAPCRGENIG